ncbi:hypothetical protein TWF481_006680 [Arthrobotrys musiformis]|uniref:BHLH domain-containing protein n=1 Tax=Arthrobotrys musiformis TaxID=47236 RepID=A0AAV9WB49_9PEZI
MRMTTRSPPMMTNHFSFPEFDASSFFHASFASPPPAPASGPSLLDDQESSAFADFLDKVGSGADSAFVFDPKMTLFDSKMPDPMMWGWHEDSTPEYPLQPTTTNPNSMLTTNLVTTPLSSERSTFALKQENGDNTSKAAPVPSIAPAEINLDPFAALHQVASVKVAPAVTASMAERPHLAIPGLQWGSDPNFKFGGYSSTVAKEVHAKKEDMLVERAMAIIAKGGYSGNTTAVNTTVNSPADNRAYPGIKVVEDEESIVSPSKRRKSFHRKTSEEEDESSSSSPYPARPRSKSMVTKDDLTSPTASKQKKKKKTKGPKRENLSEAQKRENHIQSEQKRRNLIREGFDDLCNLVPDLRGGGYSKSAILIHAANFLEQLEDGNKILQSRIKQLSGSAA